MKRFYNWFFKYFSLLCVLFSLAFLCVIFSSIIGKGYSAFSSHYLVLRVKAPPNSQLNPLSLQSSVTTALAELAQTYNIDNISDNILSQHYVYTVTSYIQHYRSQSSQLKDGGYFSIPVLLDSAPDMFLKHHKDIISQLDPNVVKFLQAARTNHQIVRRFNFNFFTNNDSRFPETTGIKGALKGSFMIILLTMIMAGVIGVGTAIFIDEYMPKNTFRSLVEININNLSAIPSIIFGLLGLSLFQNLLEVPRSSALIASLVLTLMILPTIIVYSQLALHNVPSAIKEAAYGIGASKNQVIFMHVLPMAIPGIVTGLIIGLSRALGETAPLLIIGMFAFSASSTFSITSTTSSLPTQILMWFNMPEVGFVEKTSAAIMVLLVITISINLLANYVRKKFTKKI